MATVTEKTAKLEASILAKSKELAQLKLQKAKLNHQDRGTKKKEDDRRKILIGALMMGQMEAKQETKDRMMNALDGYLKRPSERALFGLEPLPVAVAPTVQATE